MILQTNRLCKAYKKGNLVIDRLSFSLPKGKIIGLLGPNGCGKSTLIKMIAGVLQPTQGEILIDGQAVGAETKRIVSYLPERPYFNPVMKVEELLSFFAEFYSDFDRERAEQLLRDLAIDPKAKLKSLSKGTKEKVQLILVMSRKAKLYLLDEPIAGVDPAAREYILSTIVANYNPEATILITTHLITDVEQVLDEFIFFSAGGKILKAGNAEEERMRSGLSLDELFKEVFRCAQSF